MTLSRRALAGTGVALATHAHAGQGLLRVDPTPRFALSPWLRLQFMEPLGSTDASVEASWDHDANDWRPDFVEAMRDLAPGALRWGGLFSRYYRWREGVGPPGQRRPMRNHAWGGYESNRIGTAEVVRLARTIGADPLLTVNFESDGHVRYASMQDGNRSATAAEAAEWVSYCNDPDDPTRRGHGEIEPFGVKLWQLGNETSYGDDGFRLDQAIRTTAAFARAMRARDPSIRLIGWGDGGRTDNPELWATEMLAKAGEHLDLIAFHMMQQLPTRPDTVLRGRRYQADPDRAWAELMELHDRMEARLVEFEAAVDRSGLRRPIAVTEGHLSLAPHNANPILEEWMVGVYHARAMNLYRRHGDRVAMATACDCNGTRWTVVAVRVPVPRGRSYLTPVGSVMRLYAKHSGSHALALEQVPTELDVTASLGGERVFLHVANLRFRDSVEAGFAVQGRRILGGRVIEIAPDNPRQAVWQDEPDVFAPRERALPSGPAPRWRFPPASVSVVELDTAPA